MNLGLVAPLIAPFNYVSPSVGSNFTLTAFIVGVLGSMGNFAGALDWLRRSLSPGREFPARDGLAHLFLAMAHHRLGQTDEARQALDQARLMGQRISPLDATTRSPSKMVAI